MNSRMDRYTNKTNIGRRSQKNEELYKQVSQESIEEFNVNSNVSILKDDAKNIDLEMLKEMLEKKYREPSRKKTIKLEDLEEVEEQIKLEQTREYDINAILEKAKEKKTVDYETERLKKIRDTQYDILKGLDLSKKEPEEMQKVTNDEEKLMSLINTITANELSKKEKEESVDPLDILSDLKGNDNTAVIEGLKENTSSNTQINTDKIKEVVKKEVQSQIDNSFYTKSFKLSQKDFEEFKDLEDDVKTNKIFVTILTIIVILAFVFGVFLFLNNYFNWGII